MLDAKTIAAFHAGQICNWNDRDRAGLPQLEACEGCDTGIVQRVVDDYDPELGPGYQPVNGSTHCSVCGWLCPSCSDKNAGTTALANEALIARLGAP